MKVKQVCIQLNVFFRMQHKWFKVGTLHILESSLYQNNYSPTLVVIEGVNGVTWDE
jgi:hypothetical protein